MSTLTPSQINQAELSDDEGYHLVVSGASQQLDNSRVSAMYLSRHGDEFHEALDVAVNPTTYSEHRGQVEVLRTPNVKAALEWYRKENTDVPFDVFNCSWDDLFSQMARAQGDHEAKAGKKGNWFKYLWRKAGSKSDAIEPWLHLIPDEYGLSLVRGAIGIVFHMAEKSLEKEKAILEGFEAITETIHNAMSKGVSFQREPEMHACCQALYDCLVEGIADLIWSLKPEPKGKNFIDRFKNKQDRQKGINIEGMLKKVQKKSVELDQCAERIMAKKALESHQGIGSLKKEAVVSRAMLVDAKVGQDKLIEVAQQNSDDLQVVGRGMQYLGTAANHFAQTYDSTMRQMLEETKALRQRLQFMHKDRAQILSAAESQNATIAMLTETVLNLDRKQDHLMEEQSQLTRDIRRSLTPVPMDVQLILMPPTFFDLLGVPLKLANDDLHTALTRSGDFNRRSQQQAQTLLATKEFGHWLRSEDSEILLVDGNDPMATRGLVSPLSMLCATLSAALERSRGPDSAIVLQFFCGLHVGSDDNVQGPIGMVRALLVQLAAALLSFNPNQEFNFGCVPNDEFCEDVREQRPKALFHAFARLLSHVPVGVTVFCLIDGVSAFEDGRFQEDLVDTVAELERLVSADRRTLKVLLTCPYRSIFLAPRGHISRRDYVILDAGGRGGLGLVSEQSVVSLISRPE